jgi:hypothetical protein
LMGKVERDESRVGDHTCVVQWGTWIFCWRWGCHGRRYHDEIPHKEDPAAHYFRGPQQQKAVQCSPGNWSHQELLRHKRGVSTHWVPALYGIAWRRYLKTHGAPHLDVDFIFLLHWREWLLVRIIMGPTKLEDLLVSLIDLKNQRTEVGVPRERES